MKTYCRRMDISGENFIRKYIAAFIYDKLENGNMPSIFAYYGSISKNEARRRLENSPEFVASVIDQIAYEMSWHLKTRTVREHIYGACVPWTEFNQKMLFRKNSDNTECVNKNKSINIPKGSQENS